MIKMERVLITGALSGMGLSATKLFLEKGWKVMMADVNESRADEVINKLEDEGYHEVFFKYCDLTEAEDVEKLYSYTMDKLGGIDSIINNAGVAATGMLHETEESEWHKVFDVDVKSIYLTSKYFVPYMIDNGGGTIVNTASISGLQADYNMAVYNAAKGAVVNLVRAMALDYGKYNIRVNNVCPYATKTPMFLANPQEVVDQFQELNPLNRIANPEEIAQTMYFLASESSSFINGANLPVSGGIENYTGQPAQ